MCYAGGCNPECDNCRPKYLRCPQCGNRQFIIQKNCTKCGYNVTDEDRDNARAEWKELHPLAGKNKEQGPQIDFV